ncbi:PhzF family phenazine biosynthesis protein [Nocardia pseudobrasiliensis]|uniref:Putative PhzF superfamily epimerase YddE/YHI9 n=1 Tax=Nocardia pseudobrasiliensis TaxID=45979 RepID=A0A370HWA3_9NOCA|nr:PhzF family phenazine biosynthesis protein [Nocardia pseudobrasiliensis]RDI62779.1 putative PhzF superfamily epimerase YddE/YHI9 [Nocardia pseudobrasiliensis]
MRVTTVDMFGTAPGRGSLLDVLVPENEAEPVAAVIAHARETEAIESVLVTESSRAERTFGSRIFNADGETPFATHSVAGVAAWLVRADLLDAGEVGRTNPAGPQWLWTDGHRVRVPFDGPVVHQRIPHDPAEFGPYEGTSHAGGVGRAFNFVRVTEDPRALPVPDLDRMRDSELTDLTFFRWDPDRREVLARVFAPGFGIPEDTGCLPAAAALGLAALELSDGAGAPVSVRQVTRHGTESVFGCDGSIRDGVARMRVAGRIWMTDDEKGGQAS